MYESFFGLAARPFLPSPLAERYYPAAAAEAARETVLRCVERAEGPALLLGPAGTGKSTLCQVLAQQLRDRFRVGMLASARLCTRRALLQNILFELQLPYRERDEGELRLALIDALEPTEACPHGMVLIVDEAHVLPLRLLEEIRLITNVVRQGEPRVRLVLAGGMLLEERLAAPRLESLNQRVAARCYLQAMNRDETLAYVRAQIAAVGGDPHRVFAADALTAVHRATDGVPRLVNQLCDHVMLMAAVGRRAPIDAAGVEEAWADLQQLPTPWNRDEPHRPAGNAMIEFGQLDDEPEGAATDTPPPAAPTSAGDTATVQLDRIQMQLGELTRGTEASAPAGADAESATEFRPAPSRSPEIELVFHRAPNPFSEPFAEEELLVEPRDGPPPASDAVALSLGSSAQPHCVPGAITQQMSDARSRGTVPLVPRRPDVATVPHPATTPFVMRSTAHADELPGDDRDLLEVVDEATTVPNDYALALEAQRPRRREYRQLFASLRRR
ncbi:MAG: AAA family ATPase [Pirellulaceae bacterium]|jgi:type II secretory pathway predicted ATPase ExeA|nr:AAA family ATPase [Pirellulaceae bacterium]